MLKKIFILVIIFLLVGVAKSNSQVVLYKDTLRIYYGFFAGGNYIFNESIIPLIPNTNDCGNFINGNSQGFLTGINAGYKIFGEYLSADGRIFYERRPLELQAYTSSFEIYNPVDDQYEPFVRRHNFDGKVDYFALHLGLRGTPYPEIPISIATGIELSDPLFGSDYRNYETVSSPEGVLFPNGRIERNVQTGEIPRISSNYGVYVSLGYKINLKYNIYLTPELSYRHGLNSVSKTWNWMTDIIRLSLGLTWDELEYLTPNLPLNRRPPPKFPPSPQMVLREPVFEKKIEIKKEEPKVEHEKIIINSDNLMLTETVVTQTYPLLPYLFFDSANVELKSKYKLNPIESKSFNPDNLPKKTIDIYYRVLDVIGYRMKNNPNAKITVVGYYDGIEVSQEKSLELAKKRAESVQRYLLYNYDIVSNRIKVEVGATPPLATSTAYNEGFQENRRVEILAGNDVLEPVVHSKFLEYTTSDSLFDIAVDKNKLVNVEKGIVNFYVDDIKKFSVDAVIINKKIHLELNTHHFEQLVSQSQKAVIDFEYSFNGEKIVSDKWEFGIDITKNNFEVGRLNLIVFDFDRAEITPINKVMLDKFLTTSIAPTSLTSIIGSTDRLGEANYNQKLSLDRAKVVERVIKNIYPNLNIIEVKGIGMSNLNYDNNLPEGRFYCRTVLVEVKTPIK